jgi:hypothetical protein
MKILKNKKQKIFTILLISLLTLIVSIYVVFEKPTAEVNQHPMPNTIGRIELASYKDISSCSRYYSLTNEPKLLSQDLNSTYIPNDIKVIDLISLNLKIFQNNELLPLIKTFSPFFVSSSLKVENNRFIFYTYLNSSEWNQRSYYEKEEFLQNLQTQIKKNWGEYELYIYSCGDISTWVAYISNTSGEDILRFDWRESIWEQFVRKLKNDWR